MDKINHFQWRKDVFEKGASPTFTGCGCTCPAVSVLSYVIDSSSVLGDYCQKGNFMVVETEI